MKPLLETPAVRRVNLTLLTSASMLLFTGEMFAQGPGRLLYEHTGTGQYQEFGTDTADLGDINGDGISDYALGTTATQSSGIPGYVRIYSGADGSEIRTLSGTQLVDLFGESLANAGDVDGDSIPDIIIGARAMDLFLEPNSSNPNEGRAQVFSGADGSLLLTLDGTETGEWFGFDVAGLGDVNGDGLADLAVQSQRFASWAGRVQVFSGADGQRIWEVRGDTLADPEAFLSGQIAAIDDLDGDMIQDLVTGNLVLSGADGGVVMQIDRTSSSPNVVAAGDINGDGFSDFMLGDQDDFDLYSGLDGRELMIEQGEGRPLAAGRDVNLDGVNDLLVGWPSGSLGRRGRASVISGADGSFLFHRHGNKDDDLLGLAGALLGDLDGDSRPDLLVGAEQATINGAERVGYAQVIATDPSIPSQANSGQEIAAGETPVSGTIFGTFIDTQSDDGFTQAITERTSGGKPQNRHSFLEHRWSFDLPAADTVTFFVEAYHTANSEGDNFAFEWSSDGNSWAPLLVVSDTAANPPYQSVNLGSFVSGSVQVRVVDTDQSAGNTALDTVFVDHMYFFFEAGSIPAQPPATPTVQAAPTPVASIVLTWNEDGTEDGWRVQRSTGGAPMSNRVFLIGTEPSFEDRFVTPGETYDYRIQGFNGAGDSAWSTIVSATPSQGGGGSDEVASSEQTVAGLITSGSYADTTANDDVYEVIREEESGGKPSNRTSLMDHRWTIDVPAGATSLTFFVKGFMDANSEGDVFDFSWSINGSSWSSLLTIDRTVDDGSYQSAVMPVTSGQVMIRVEDRDRSAGNRSREELFVDHLFIQMNS
ncbi:MAG: integrin alpha [Planctomycetota bacterium]